MKTSLDQLLQRIKNLSKTNLSSFSGRKGTHWKFLVYTLLAISTSALVLDSFLFLQIKEEISKLTEAKPVGSYTNPANSLLDQTLNTLKKRGEQYELYRSEKPKIVDPSS